MSLYYKIEIKTEMAAEICDVSFKLAKICQNDNDELDFIDDILISLKEALRLNGFTKRNIDKIKSIALNIG